MSLWELPITRHATEHSIAVPVTIDRQAHTIREQNEMNEIGRTSKIKRKQKFDETQKKQKR